MAEYYKNLDQSLKQYMEIKRKEFNQESIIEFFTKTIDRVRNFFIHGPNKKKLELAQEKKYLDLFLDISFKYSLSLWLRELLIVITAQEILELEPSQIITVLTNEENTRKLANNFIKYEE